MRFGFLLDPFILLPVVGLSTISAFIAGSTTPDLLWYQVLFLTAGVGVYIFVGSLDSTIWPKLVPLLYVSSLILLGIVFFGPNVRGATRWIDLGPFRLQPSEIIKPWFIVIMSYFFARQSSRSIKMLFLPVGMALPILFAIFHQPDLGNVLVYIAILLGLIIMAGLPWRVLAILGIICLIAVPLSWFVLKDYQKQRIETFLRPESDPAGAGYNALQATIALGSGQLFGLGLGKGTQSRLLFLPEYHTDFVFASIGEELGFLGVSVILLFYLVLLLRLLRISAGSSDAFEQLVVVGIFSQLFIQVFINIGMNVGILPITGITLPLVSYGGSSVLSTYFDLGLIAAIQRRRRAAPLVIR